MIDQPEPTPGGTPVTPRALERISDALHYQHRKGIERYDMPLSHPNGRDHAARCWQELADLCQELAALEMERDDLRAKLEAVVAWACDTGWRTFYYDPPPPEAEELFDLSDRFNPRGRAAHEAQARVNRPK